MSSKRIAEELRSRIATGVLKPGDHVPSARQITREWGVAIATASKALALLQDEGLVRAVPGVGTIVNQDLSRERIVAAALLIADREGLGAVSMRRLAHELGVAAMSLYRYVPGKEELVLLIADAAFAAEPPISPGLGRAPDARAPDARAMLAAAARHQWRIYRKHPWLAGALSLLRPQLLPHGMAHTERTLQALAALGLPPAQLLVAGLTVIGYVRGVALNLETEAQAEQDTGVSRAAYMAAQAAAFQALLRGGTFPALQSASAQPDLDVGPDALFEFGLARLIDGLARPAGPGPGSGSGPGPGGRIPAI